MSKLFHKAAFWAVTMTCYAAMIVGAQTTLTKSAPKAAVQPAPNPPSDKEIADAKAKGLVWTNPTTKVFHKDGEFYGKTKNGKFMTESDAVKQYYRPAPDAARKGASTKAAAAPATVPPASAVSKAPVTTAASKTAAPPPVVTAAKPAVVSKAADSSKKK